MKILNWFRSHRALVADVEALKALTDSLQQEKGRLEKALHDAGASNNYLASERREMYESLQRRINALSTELAIEKGVNSRLNAYVIRSHEG